MKTKKEKSGIIKPINIFSKNKKLGELKRRKSTSNNKLYRNTASNKKKQVVFWNKLQSIKIKLSIGLLIPVVLLAVYGVMSYKKSEDAIIGNYESSTLDTVDAMSKYMNLGLKIIENSSLELTSDINFRQFISLSLEEARTRSKTYDDMYDRISIIAIANDFISEVHVVGNNGLGLSSTDNINDNLYSSIAQSDIGKTFREKNAQYLWVGNHSELDEIMMKSGTYNTESYATSIIRRMSGGEGYVIMDVSNKVIQDMFNKYEMGEGSILGYITADGREILSNTNASSIFTNLSYFQDALKSEKQSDYSYQTYNEEEYLFIYSKFEDLDGTICALVPKSTILNEVRSIKFLSSAFVTISCLIAILVVLLITGGITRTIKSLNKSISQASKGDLTTQFDLKRKDEFLALSTGISHMMEHMRHLIGEVQQVSSTVNDSAVGLTNTAGDLLYATKGISKAIDETGQGIVEQVENTENCLNQMSSLSNQINQVYNNTNEIEQIANNTQVVASEGIHIINELNNKSKATSEITQDIICKIQEFEIQSKKIEGFVKMINDIASQTNLLSLNASIEAARAGEAGIGFAVVAEEIRKLADQSVNAANQIQSTVKNINIQNKEAVSTAERAENIVNSQTEALSSTVKVFNNIGTHINNLANNLNDIIERVKTIEMAKDDTLNAIQNISSVTQQTAASTEEVNATAQNQIESVERLREAAIVLQEDANKLENAIKIFKIK